ncbi:MAG: ATP-binding protein [Chitinivibrionales bacterium]|nr:ATP-binding protein [Chitinivibrionales bacterium]
MDFKDEAAKKSFFLFGPRQTGKTFLLNHLFPQSLCYNLLHADVFLGLSLRPETIRERVAAGGIKGPVIIDEIQKMPVLLDEVHAMIESTGATFVLTGSSGRKLRRGGANLLGGRARTRHLFPLVFPEIPQYDFLRIINFGSIPSIYTSDDPAEDLTSYCGNYLKEEIAAEGLVRKIESFSRFLQLAALTNGELLNFTSIASDAGVPPRTVREFFSILEDTLIGAMLPPFSHSGKRKAVSTAKFYFFDVGVANCLAGRSAIKPKTELFGKALEHLVFTELRAYLSYAKDRRELSFWRDRFGHEVDFIVGDSMAIEVKAAALVSEKHLGNLKMLSEEIPFKHRIIVSMDSHPRKIGNIRILPLRHFLESLWGGELQD